MVPTGSRCCGTFSRTDAGAGLIEGSTGQTVMREIVQDYLRYVGFASDDYPDRLELKPFEPTKVIIDPYRSSGQPVFAGTGTKVANVAAVLKGGEDPGIVAEEHGIGIDHVRSAARVLLGRASLSSTSMRTRSPGPCAGGCGTLLYGGRSKCPLWMIVAGLA